MTSSPGVPTIVGSAQLAWPFCFLGLVVLDLLLSTVDSVSRSLAALVSLALVSERVFEIVPSPVVLPGIFALAGAVALFCPRSEVFLPPAWARAPADGVAET